MPRLRIPAPHGVVRAGCHPEPAVATLCQPRHHALMRLLVTWLARQHTMPARSRRTGLPVRAGLSIAVVCASRLLRCRRFSTSASICGGGASGGCRQRRCNLALHVVHVKRMQGTCPPDVPQQELA